MPHEPTFPDISVNSGDVNILLIVAHTVAIDNSLFVCITLESDASDKEVLSVVWSGGGGALTLFDFFNPSHGKMRHEIWSTETPGVAISGTITITLEGGNSQKIGATAFSVDGQDVITLSRLGTEEQDGSGASGAVSVTQDDEDLAMIVVGHFNTDAIGPADTENEESDTAVGGSFRHATYSQDGSGVTSLGWTSTGSVERSTMGFIVEGILVGGVVHKLAGADGLIGPGGGLVGQGGGLIA